MDDNEPLRSASIPLIIFDLPRLGNIRFAGNNIKVSFAVSEGGCKNVKICKNGGVVASQKD